MKNIITLCICFFLLLGCSSNVETIKLELLPMYQKIPHSYSESYLKVANEHFRSKRYDSVLVYCHKSFAQDSENWELFYLYGITATELSEYKIADNYLYKALTFSNSDRVNRAKVYFALGENADRGLNYRSAKQHYLMVIQLDADSDLAQIASKKILLLSQID